MIRRARREDIPLLTALWETCFGDARAYIAFFFQNRFSAAEAFLWEEGGAPVSALFLFPACLCHGEKRYAARYLYAACTAPAFRARGIMRRLIDAAARSCAANGVDCIALVPAGEGLFRYYAGCGFQTAFFCETASLSRRKLELLSGGRDTSAFPLALSEMAAIRRQALHGRDYLDWDEAALSYALAEHRYGGGDAAGTRTPAGAGYCLFHTAAGKDACFVQELLCSGEPGPLFSALLYASGAHSFSVRAPVGMLPACAQAEKRAFGMLRPLSARAAHLPQELKYAYLGLSLG